jgi:hydrogenase expression/formation protein HypD
MNLLDPFRDPDLINGLRNEISRVNDESRTYTFMEVCGTHTMAIARYGIHSIIPENIRLVSGPGCPVCVTPVEFVDTAIELAKQKDVIITTFGDMLRVPGSETTLYYMRAEGMDIRIVYSPTDAVGLARENGSKTVVFLAVGFETTTPTIAGAIKIAERENISNFAILNGNKIMPPAMTGLAASGDLKLDGFICPPHVSAITGTKIYDFLAEDYSKGCVVAGFEPTDLLQAILMLIRQINEDKIRVENQYSRVVTVDGNQKARDLVDFYFTPVDSRWRGLGIIPLSGLTLKDEYIEFNALTRFEVDVADAEEDPYCICGDVLTGRKLPTECRLFGKGCTPDSPKGACMVSAEGSCAAYYKYR